MDLEKKKMERQSFNKASQTIRFIKISACIILCLAGITSLSAATAPPVPITLSNIPMNLSQGVPPNILLTLDTSGSMKRFYLPEALQNDSGGNPQDQSSDFNYVYYNPDITYRQSVDANGNTLPAGPTFTVAWPDGYDHGACVNKSNPSGTIDLSTNFIISWDSQYGCTGVNKKATAAFYYARNNSTPTASCPADPPLNFSNFSGCYHKVTLDGSITSFPKASTRTDCAGTTCTLAEERQNFANWFTYYRSRLLMAKTTASLAFSTLNNSVRVTHQTLYSTIPQVQVFTGNARTNFFSWLQSLTANNGTPLRQALDRAGQFFSLDSSSTNDPYLATPGDTTSKEYSCQQNFNVLITDGEWNQALTSNDPGHVDDASTPLPVTTDGISNYTPQLPYSTGTTNNGLTTLADFAFKYWVTDLRPKLANNVPAYTPGNSSFYDASSDPATWQHLVNFMIPLGLTGTLTHTDANAYNPFINNGINNGFTYWPFTTTADYTKETTADRKAKVDDLWHAAINSRGEFYSAKNPAELTSALTNIFSSISTRQNASSAGAAISAAKYMAGNYVYQPSYMPGDWYGDLVQYDITSLQTQLIHANTVLQNQNNNGQGRDIITYNTSSNKGAPFEWDKISASQQTALGGSSNGQNILNYIRGDQSNELQNKVGAFRNRTYVLGDIVDSTPAYVGAPNLRYPDSIESSSGAQKYSDFVANNKNRKPMVWVGANDGMLHGFDAKTLQELVAYVPSSIYQNLPALTKPTYTHRYYVDGSPTESDVMFSDSKWHSIIVGGLNAGGRGIYALDITDPTTFSNGGKSASQDESISENDVLWDFTPASDPQTPNDLGYTFSQPQITKMNDGTWAVVFGNGYNSPNGDAVLYIVNAETGALIKKIDVGHVTDPTGKNRMNGLSSVTLSDINGDFKTDYIYAGDLYGNLWKFDVSGSTINKWTVETNSGGTPTPLFSTNGQPITTAPVVAYNAYQHGYMILFGTGSYLSPGDLSDRSIQSFYGIWDRNQEAQYGFKTITRNDTLAQTITVDNYSQFSSVNARVTSNNAITWYLGTQALPPIPSTDGYLGWRIDFVEPDGTKNGERVTSNPQVVGNRVIFITDTLNSDPCNGGTYSSWLMELNASTGQPLPASPFDYNGDGMLAVGNGGGDLILDSANNPTLVGSGIQFKNGGQLNAAALAAGNGGNEVKIGSKGNGTLVKIAEPPPNTGLRSWIELQ